MRKTAGVVVGLCLLASHAVLDARAFGILRTTVKASIIDTRGMTVGEASVGNSKKHGSLVVKVKVWGLPQGAHGIHLHMVGACTGPDFTSAGAHWNPENRMHGLHSTDGHHMGDLPSIAVGKKGKGKLEYDIPMGQFSGEGGLMDSDGAAIVIHEQADDDRSDPGGNSGARIACGVLVR